MNITFDREELRVQREVLRTEFDNYDPKHHDVFVDWYNKRTEKRALMEYMKNRNIEMIKSFTK
uniref:Uncharacterized protein n=1 Tax=viral metagenome TaxID=1070528 RepID=A0A6M3JBL7_9ZZZZ